MGKIIRNGIEFSSTSDTADNINYNNSKSGLEAMTVQEAVDEVVDNLTESFGGLSIRFNSETGKPEWKERGADTFNPFSGNSNFTITVVIVARARYTGNNFVAGSITITRTIRYENGELVYSTDATDKKNFTPSSTSLFIDAYIESVAIEFD